MAYPYDTNVASEHASLHGRFVFSRCAWPAGLGSGSRGGSQGRRPPWGQRGGGLAAHPEDATWRDIVLAVARATFKAKACRIFDGGDVMTARRKMRSEAASELQRLQRPPRAGALSRTR